MDRPACTPAAIRAVLAANADPDVLQSYDRELDAAYEHARRDQNLTELVQTVRRWWFEADAWRDPDTQRQFLATSASPATRSAPGTASDLYHWEADEVVGMQLASLPRKVRHEFATFMDAVVIVDPMDYQRSPGEPPMPLRLFRSCS